MSFGTRLAEERKRLGLKQAEFADLVGTDVPKQSLYENDRRELRADYLARLAEADVDIVYVLTGRRRKGWRARSATSSGGRPAPPSIPAAATTARTAGASRPLPPSTGPVPARAPA